MALQKQVGCIRPILSGEIWRRCFANLAVKLDLAAKLFTSNHDNFIQTAGIRDDASHFAKILSVFYDNLDISDPTSMCTFAGASGSTTSTLAFYASFRP